MDFFDQDVTEVQQTVAENQVFEWGHESIENYQEFFGLTVDGIAGPVTTSEIARPRCGCPDRMSDRSEKASWPRSCMKKTFAYKFDQMTGISQVEIRDSISKAFVALNRMSAAKVSLGGTLSDADIWATDGPLRGSTLAWSFLPDGSCSDCIEQRYDTSNQNWSASDKLAKVLLHEVGHAFGLQHSNDERDIMFPSINPNRPLSFYAQLGGMPGDRSRMVAAYGEFDPGGDPPADPTNNDKLEEFIRGIHNLADQFLE